VSISKCQEPREKKIKCSGVPAYHMRSGVAPAAVIGASSESWESLVILHKDREIWVIHNRGNERERERRMDGVRSLMDMEVETK
jgi:hypothetical protein